MSLLAVDFPVALRVEAPMLVSAPRSHRYGLDVAQMRDAQGRVIVPDTHFKGVLREAWEYAHGPTNVLFGDEGGEGDVGEAPADLQGTLVFSDLVCVAGLSEDLNDLTRIAIDDEIGTVREGALFFVEALAKPGTPLVFEGLIRGHLPSHLPPETFRERCRTAFEFVGAIGRFKTVGFGRVIDFDIRPTRQRNAPPKPSRARSYRLSFALDRRLLQDIRRPDANTLDGSAVLTGAVVKGALAEALRRAGDDLTSTDMRSALTHLRIGHVLPTIGDQLVEDPASLAGRLDTVVAGSHPKGAWPPQELVTRSEKELARFAPDWKEEDWPSEAGLDLLRDVRTRVAISENTGAARPGALFTESAVAPILEDGTAVTWTGRVDLPTEPHEQLVEDALTRAILELSRGLQTIGRTRAAMTDIRLDPAPSASHLSRRKLWTVVLRTPCLMLREIHLMDETIYAIALDRYWREASGGTLRIATEAECRAAEGHIDHVFATDDLEYFCHQDIQGGYVARRFAWHQPPPGSGASDEEDWLEPFVLSRAGSVFRLMAEDPGAAADWLGEVLRSGLPAAAWSADGQTLRFAVPEDFEMCPFLPENGFGEIVVEGAQ